MRIQDFFNPIMVSAAHSRIENKAISLFQRIINLVDDILAKLSSNYANCRSTLSNQYRVIPINTNKTGEVIPEVANSILFPNEKQIEKPHSQQEGFNIGEKLIKPSVSENQLIEFKSKMRSNKGFWYNEKSLETHAEALCQAYLLTQELNKNGKPVLYTAQTTESIFLHIVIKLFHESIQGEVGNHRKIMRTDYTASIEDIHDAQWSDYATTYQSLIAASTNIFDCNHGESVNFYLLNSGKSQTNHFSLKNNLAKELENYKVSKRFFNDFIPTILAIYGKYINQLPERLLILLILDHEDLSSYVRPTKPYGSPINNRTDYTDEEIKQNILTYNQEDATKGNDCPQVRVLAPRPNLPKVKALRLLAQSHQEILKQAKQELEAEVNKLVAKVNASN